MGASRRGFTLPASLLSRPGLRLLGCATSLLPFGGLCDLGHMTEPFRDSLFLCEMSLSVVPITLGCCQAQVRAFDWHCMVPGCVLTLGDSYCSNVGQIKASFFAPEKRRQ